MGYWNAANMKKFTGFYSLVMVNRQKKIFVGLFPSKRRAQKVANFLDWPGFHQIIQKEEARYIANTPRP